MTILTYLDLAVTVIFALSGALAAARKEMDIMGFLWLGAAAGVGGGSLRDLVLDVPVFWVDNPTPLILCLLAAGAMHFIAPIFQSRIRVLIWFDAIGMAFAATAGTLKTLSLGHDGIVAVVMGVFTASLGGVIRDLLANEPTVISGKDIYVSAAAIGAATVVAFHGAGMPALISAGAGFGMAFLLRAGAIAFNLKFPSYKSRPPAA